MWCCYAWWYTAIRKGKKSFQHCSYVKVIKIFDKVLSKSCIGNFDVFRKDFVLFFSSVSVLPVRRCCVYTAVDMFTIKQTLLCFGVAGSLDMQIVIDTLTPWDEETFRKSKPFPFSQQRRRFFGIFLKTFLLKLAMHNPPCMLHRILHFVLFRHTIVFACLHSNHWPGWRWNCVLQVEPHTPIFGIICCLVFWVAFFPPYYSGKEQQCLLYLLVPIQSCRLLLLFLLPLCPKWTRKTWYNNYTQSSFVTK